MKNVIVKKILNNNLILVSDEMGKEHIVMGKGLRFSNTVGEELVDSSIEKVFVLKEENTKNYMNLLEEAPKEYVEAVQEAVRLANLWSEEELNEQLFITLFDHLIYAIERYNNHIVLQNRMLWELKQFYPKEYQVSKRVLDFLNKELELELPEEEAGNIAFHLVNAQPGQKDMGNTIMGIKMQKNIFNIIQVTFQKKLDVDSIDYARLVIHIQFFLQRLFGDKMLEDKDDSFYEHLKEKLPKEMTCARQIQRYIENTVHKTITEEEIVYLAVHISRVTA